jgi:hypothetical protein
VAGHLGLVRIGHHFETTRERLKMPHFSSAFSLLCNPRSSQPGKPSLTTVASRNTNDRHLHHESFGDSEYPRQKIHFPHDFLVFKHSVTQLLQPRGKNVPDRASPALLPPLYLVILIPRPSEAGGERKTAGPVTQGLQQQFSPQLHQQRRYGFGPVSLFSPVFSFFLLPSGQDGTVVSIR